jgi:hypothetical protein
MMTQTSGLPKATLDEIIEIERTLVGEQRRDVSQPVLAKRGTGLP